MFKIALNVKSLVLCGIELEMGELLTHRFVHTWQDSGVSRAEGKPLLVLCSFPCHARDITSCRMHVEPGSEMARQLLRVSLSVWCPRCGFDDLALSD